MNGGKTPLGLYLHIPFCVSKCGYCDFYSVTDTAEKQAYVSALCRQIQAYSGVCAGNIVDTIYLGGGTPSCLGAELLDRILQTVQDCFLLDGNAEITVECNPESTDKTLLDALKAMGVNRLSFGVQSAHDDELRLLGRVHTFEQARQAVRLAQDSGFDNISLDLMYGLPGQSVETFLDSVEKTLLLEPQHLSAYGLTLEPTTRMGREKPVLPDDDTQADMYLALCAALRRAGFEHYEISNFARPTFRSRHNQKYWNLSDYLGVGPGAHSYMNGRRFAFRKDLRAYIAGDDLFRDEEDVPAFRRQGEYLMLRLRTLDGVDLSELKRRYNVDTRPYAAILHMLSRQGLTAQSGGSWHLTETGFLVSNSIINVVVDAGRGNDEE